MLVLALTDGSTKLHDIRSVLSPAHVVHSLSSSEEPGIVESASALVVDVELRKIENIERIQRVQAALSRIKKRIFVVERASHLSIAQAYSLGATSVVFDLLDVGKLEGVARDTLPWGNADTNKADETTSSDSISEAALASLFSCISRGEAVRLEDAVVCTDGAIASIQAYGLTQWLDRVRSHHLGTFQHCLLVTGTAIDFAMCLGFGAPDVKRLGLAATLHDIGKATIPRLILDKPGRLSACERAIIEQHPVLGHDALREVPGIDPEVRLAIRHHHEFLDGSGYPDRLQAAQIPDLVRMLTISDIFAALIELRSYKPPMLRHTAYEILRGMDGKLEAPLVKAFRDVALLH